MNEIVEDVHVLRAMNANIHAAIITYARAIRGGHGIMEVKAKVLNLIEVAANWNDLVAGATTAMGRGLQIFNHTLQPDGTLKRMLSLDQDFVNMTDEEWLRWSVGVISAKSNSKRQKLLFRKPGAQNMLAELYVNNIISGPITSMVNVTSVAITGIFNPISELLGTVINKTIWDRSSGQWGADVLDAWNSSMDEIIGIITTQSDGVKLLGTAGTLDTLGRAAGRFSKTFVSLDSTHANAARQIIEESDIKPWMKTLFTGRNYLDPARGARASELGMDKTLGASHTGSRLRAITSDNVSDMINRTPLIGQYNPGRIARHGTPGGKLVDALGVTSSLVARLVSTGDELTKGIFYRANLVKQARRIAREEGLEGVDFHKYVKDATENVPRWAEMDIEDPLMEVYEGMHRDAIEHARTVSFTNPVNSQPALVIQDAISKAPIVKLFVPFIRTPTNLLKYVFERTPVIYRWSKRYKNILKKLDDDPKSVRAKRELELFQAHATTGKALWGTAFYLALNDKITGAGPTNPHERRAKEMTGWKPFSIWVGTKEDGTPDWVQYRRGDPYGTYLGFASTVAENFAEVQEAPGGAEMSMELAGTIMGASAIIAKDKSYYQGMSDLFDMFDGRLASKDKIQRWLAKTSAALVVPNLYSSIATTGVYPFTEGLEAIYEAETVLDHIKKKAGIVDSLYPHRNMFGEVIPRPLAIGWDWLSPFFTNEQKTSPLKDLLAESNYGADFRAKTESIAGEELPARMRDRLKRVSGTFIKRELEAALPELRMLGVEIKSQGVKGGRLARIESIVADNMEDAKDLVANGWDISEDGNVYKLSNEGSEEDKRAYREAQLFTQRLQNADLIKELSEDVSGQLLTETGESGDSTWINNLIDENKDIKDTMKSVRERIVE